jgi:hypothetical protein
MTLSRCALTQRAKLATEMIAVIRGLGCVAANAPQAAFAAPLRRRN